MASWSMDAYYSYHLSSSAETLFVAVSSIIKYCGSICNNQGVLSRVYMCVSLGLQGHSGAPAQCPPVELGVMCRVPCNICSK